MAKRPLVIAHRGASDQIAEHTLAAYQEAIDAGADALECDVRLTADTVLVCVHDRRIDRVSSGRGVVANYTLAELQRHDFASWKNGGWNDDVNWQPPQYREVSSSLLTFDALLDLVAAAPRPVGLSVETKHPSRFGGLVEDLLVETLRKHGLVPPPKGPGSVRIMSFAEVALRRARRLAPKVPRVLLMDRVPVRFRSGWLPYGARYAGPSIAILREHPGYVRRVHETGGKVHVWTVDDPADVELCLRLGVDGIITNRPRAVRAQVDQAVTLRG